MIAAELIRRGANYYAKEIAVIYKTGSKAILFTENLPIELQDYEKIQGIQLFYCNLVPQLCLPQHSPFPKPFSFFHKLE